VTSAGNRDRRYAVSTSAAVVQAFRGFGWIDTVRFVIVATGLRNVPCGNPPITATRSPVWRENSRRTSTVSPPSANVHASAPSFARSSFKVTPRSIRISGLSSGTSPFSKRSSMRPTKRV